MPSTHERRTLLRLAASGALVGLTGCLSSGSETNSPTTAPGTSASAPSGSSTTQSETATTTTRPTNTCDEQAITPDVVVENTRDESVAVTVTVEDRTTDSVLLDTIYEVPAGGRVEEDDPLFSSLDPETDHEIWATATVRGSSPDSTDEADVSVVARNPTVYGIQTRVHKDDVSVFDSHGDPGPDVNWNCYPRD
ncbi:hypothetical protein C453_17369 [Haloferax elongans ATCC BAA-1513]|uniref:Lipoprotein n=1 Tax=Haloferax elongans ATCC BAA-1513 TaxID=1230453 RepID=M0HDB8_HALEO|nr:hypothetical protein [Haloferax elongans]ELZ81808.1 hypothetical protein C453_17369 [Haloferax elongans ATCC BAA-1513]